MVACIHQGQELTMVTRGARRLGRTIRKLNYSVEFSTKESRARADEIKHNQRAREALEYDQESPVQDLRNLQRKAEYRPKT